MSRTLAWHGVRIALLVAGAIWGPSLARPAEEEADPTEQISTLRASGDYANARKLCVRYAAGLAPDTLKWVQNDARRLLVTLDHILAMPAADRARMRVADSLGVAMQAAYYENEFGTAARDAAACRVIQEELLGTDHRETWETRSVEALALEELGAFDRSLPLMEQVVAAAVRLYESEHPFRDVASNNLALQYDARGRFEEAERHYRESLRIARLNAGQDSLGLATSLNNLAENLKEQGDLRGAIRAHSEALDIRRSAAGAASTEYAQSALNLGSARSEAGEALAAIGLLGEAIRIYRDHADRHGDDLAAALLGLGQARYVLHEYAAAESAFAAAVELRERTRGTHHVLTERSRVNHAIAIRERGRVDEAVRRMRPAVQALASVLGDDHVDVIWGCRNLAETLFMAGDNSGAESLLVRVSAAFERVRLRISAGDRRSRFASSPEPLLAVLRIRRGEGQLAWEGFERSLARGLGDQIAFARAPEITHEERSRESALRRRLLLAEQRVEAASWNGEPIPDSLRSEREARLAEWQSFVADLQVRLPSAFQARPVGLRALQSVLTDHEVVLGWLHADYANGRDVHYAYVIRHTGEVAWVPLPPDSASNHTALLRRALRSHLHLPGAIAQVAALRVDPVRPSLADATSIKVIPAGDMLGLPFDLLLSRPGRRAAPVPVSYALSATLLQHARTTSRAPPARRPAALILCDPPFRAATVAPVQGSESPFSAGSTRAPQSRPIERGRRLETAMRVVDSWSRDSLARLDALPHTREEGRSIAKIIGPSARVLEGEACTEQAVVALARSDSLRTFRLLHFASHALIDERDPERSALVLSQLARTGDDHETAGTRSFDGLVTVREIRAEWRLDADLVTLSACETGLGEAVEGEGYIGFVQALMSVGARSLLISLWEMEDLTTSLMMGRFYDNLLGSRRMSAAAALAEAREWLRAGAGGKFPPLDDYSYLWSGFVLFGE